MSTPQKKTDPPSAAVVDEFGRLDAELALLKPKLDRHEELRKQIAACYDDQPAEQDFQAAGDQFTAVIGPRGNRRKIIDMKKVFKAMGQAIFFKLCDLPLGKLDALIPEHEQKGIVQWEKSGSRTVKVVVKTEPKK